MPAKFIFAIPRLALQRQQIWATVTGKITGWQRVSDSAIRRGLKSGQRVLLVDDADVEVNNTGVGDINVYVSHGEPKKEILRRHTGKVAYAGGREVEGDIGIIVKLVLELGDARVRQRNLEEGGGG